jgi:hypothetical protein
MSVSESRWQPNGPQTDVFLATRPSIESRTAATPTADTAQAMWPSPTINTAAKPAARLAVVMRLARLTNLFTGFLQRAHSGRWV